ncbi:MAG: DEDD exonuclease domain-containing protein, partial [Actinomycetota bacterium]
TFCVVDLETTGGSAETCGITEIGAVKVRRGEVQGTFHTLVRPDHPVPAFIRLLTGISTEMLVEAPPVEAVLPAFLEFARNSVLVAHNARFDVSFLNAACARGCYPALEQRVVDTAALARRLLAGEVPNRKLETLARHLRCAHQPCHRAYADALATVDVLHHLIERVAGYGVTTLEDLLSMSFTRMDGTFGKISLAGDLPRGIGVYRFVGAAGQTLYVGKATDVRARVRSYFYGDPRRRMRELLREAQSIACERHATSLEAEVAEARAIASECPPYNRAGKRPGTWYLKIAPGGRGRARGSKVHATRSPKQDGAVYLGPFRSIKVVRALIDALRDALPIHRCAAPERCRGCAFSEMGACTGTSAELHRHHVRAAAVAVVCDPRPVLDALAARMRRLSDQGRFEEAAEVRDRAALLERVVMREMRVRALVAAGEVAVALGERAVLVDNGRLAAAVDTNGEPPGRVVRRLQPPPSAAPPGSFLAPGLAQEAHVIASWLLRHGHEARLLRVAGTWVSPVGAAGPPRFVADR